MPRYHKPLPPQDFLLKILRYDPETGHLFWASTGGRAFINRKHGYLSGVINGEDYQAQRIIWRMMTGEDPGPLLIDHRNLKKDDNAWENLRKATVMQNAYNARGRARTSQFKGVSLAASGTYHACIYAGGVRYGLGTFDSEREAALAYDIAAEELHGDFAVLNGIPIPPAPWRTMREAH